MPVSKPQRGEMFIVMESRNPKLQRSDREMNMSPRWGLSSFGIGGYSHVGSSGAKKRQFGCSSDSRLNSTAPDLAVVCLRNEGQRSGDCNCNVRIFQGRASARPLLGERVGVRGNEANSNPRRDDSRICQTSQVPPAEPESPNLIINSLQKLLCPAHPSLSSAARTPTW